MNLQAFRSIDQHKDLACCTTLSGIRAFSKVDNKPSRRDRSFVHPAAMSRQRRKLGGRAVECGGTQEPRSSVGIPACLTSDIHHDAAYLPADL